MSTSAARKTNLPSFKMETTSGGTLSLIYTAPNGKTITVSRCTARTSLTFLVDSFNEVMDSINELIGEGLTFPEIEHRLRLPIVL